MAYTCPWCQRTTPHPDDGREKYCPFCHEFEDDRRLREALMGVVPPEPAGEVFEVTMLSVLRAPFVEWLRGRGLDLVRIPETDEYCFMVVPRP